MHKNSSKLKPETSLSVRSITKSMAKAMNSSSSYVAPGLSISSDGSGASNEVHSLTPADPAVSDYSRVIRNRSYDSDYTDNSAMYIDQHSSMGITINSKNYNNQVAKIPDSISDQFNNSPGIAQVEQNFVQSTNRRDPCDIAITLEPHQLLSSNSPKFHEVPISKRKFQRAADSDSSLGTVLSETTSTSITPVICNRKGSCATMETGITVLTGVICKEDGEELSDIDCEASHE